MKKKKSIKDKISDTVLEKLEQEKQKYLDGWQRERADFENYKKTQKQHLDSIKNKAEEYIILDLLPIIDNMELITLHAPKDVADTQWYKGVEYAHKNIKKIFEDMGVKEIDCNGNFDPSIHESIGGRGDIIKEVSQKGYTFKKKVIRPSKVKLTDKK